MYPSSVINCHSDSWLFPIFFYFIYDDLKVVLKIFQRINIVYLKIVHFRIRFNKYFMIAWYNQMYLSQLFKKQMNTTLHDYIADLRIKKAKQLLEVTTMPIDMIAEEVGYYNTSSFIRRFKQDFDSVLCQQLFKNPGLQVLYPGNIKTASCLQINPSFLKSFTKTVCA